MMKHYMVKIVDGYSDEAVYLHFYGKFDVLIIANRSYKCIMNEENIPMFIEGLNTEYIKEYHIFGT